MSNFDLLKIVLMVLPEGSDNFQRGEKNETKLKVCNKKYVSTEFIRAALRKYSFWRYIVIHTLVIEC